MVEECYISENSILCITSPIVFSTKTAYVEILLQ